MFLEPVKMLTANTAYQPLVVEISNYIEAYNFEEASIRLQKLEQQLDKDF